MDFLSTINPVPIMALMAGLTVFAACWGILYNPGKAAAKKSLKSMYRESERDNFFVSLMKSRQDEKKRKGIKVSQKFEQEFETAGMGITASEFLTLWIGLTLIIPILAYAASGKPVAAVGGTIIGFILPLVVFMKKKNDRKEAFNGQFADVLLTICNGLHSGFSFQQAMTSITKEMEPPVSTEFSKVLLEMDYGISMHDALYHMYERTGCDDIRMLISALDITAKTGGSLADVLETISNTVRNRLKIRQEMKTLSAQGRMSGLIVGCLPIVIILALSVLNPEYIQQLVDTTTGRKLLLVACVMESIGFAIIRKITDVKL